MNAIIRTLFKIGGSLSLGGRESYRNDYDRRAESYDFVRTRPMLRNVTEELLDRIDMRPGMRCIDLGCGTGHATRIIAEKVQPAGNVVGCDVSAGMLAIAKRRKADVNVSNIHFVQRDMLAFLKERTDRTADLVSACWSAEYSRLSSLFPEIYRVLDRNGVVAILINTEDSLGELQELIAPILLKHPYYIKHFPPIHVPPDLRRFEKYARRCGVAVESIKEEVRSYNFTSSQEVVAWIMEGGPAAGLVSALKDNCLEKFFSHVRAAVDKTGGMTVTFRFIVFIGRKTHHH